MEILVAELRQERLLPEIVFMCCSLATLATGADAPLPEAFSRQFHRSGRMPPEHPLPPESTPGHLWTLMIVSEVLSPLRWPDRRPDVFWSGQAGCRLSRLIRGRKQAAPISSRTHLIDRRRAHEVATFTYLPPAAERPEPRSEAGRNGGGRAGQAALRLEQVLFSGQYGGERGCALLVLLQRDPERASSRLYAATKIRSLVPGLQICRQTVVHLLLGAQHRVLIIDQQLLKLGIL